MLMRFAGSRRGQSETLSAAAISRSVLARYAPRSQGQRPRRPRVDVRRPIGARNTGAREPAAVNTGDVRLNGLANLRSRTPRFDKGKTGRTGRTCVDQHGTRRSALELGRHTTAHRTSPVVSNPSLG
ncbi:hypothetical protein BV20DRAFT_81231 [Pilatotrama ljubarskyi]|nr:hypothetical protein BV20DRAFT_81231 [Pilatotrama ljubarskyi]